jgi:hypothetical protein
MVLPSIDTVSSQCSAPAPNAKSVEDEKAIKITFILAGAGWNWVE